MYTLDHVLKQCSVFVNGVGKAGTNENFTLPPIEKKTESYRNGGFIGERTGGAAR